MSANVCSPLATSTTTPEEDGIETASASAGAANTRSSMNVLVSPQKPSPAIVIVCGPADSQIAPVSTMLLIIWLEWSES